ncbi:signal peptidase I [Brooklawnia cerclae]|uniref:Signal peptidase I n=1 Tax=Brooklawnia cerclae TaxID=349934 RepID=A0ABX0SIE9_9ACTN|nr:signal peptidase [Brooklawnia cerclae]
MGELRSKTLSAGSTALPSSVRSRSRAKSRRIGSVARAVALVFVVLALWPATWGGLTGLTAVYGHSMEPTYRTGDLVVTVRAPSYHVGDVVSYKVPEGQPGAGGRVIHRVVSVDASSGTEVYTTKGDNNSSADEWRFGADDVLGRAVLRVPSAGRLLGPGLLPWFLAVVCGAAVIVLLWPPQEDGEPDVPATP